MHRNKTAKIIADNLTRLMVEHKHSQGDLHKKTGLSQSSIGRIMSASVSLKVDSLELIAEVYGLSPWQLLIEGIDISNPPMLRKISEKEKAFYDKIKGLIEQ